MGALMFQIHDEAGSCAAFGLGFRLKCLKSMQRTVLDPCTKLAQSVLKRKLFF